MSRFKSFQPNETPNQSIPMVEKIQAENGFEPNIIKGIKRSPQLLKSYTALSDALEKSSLSEEEQHIVLLTVSRFNECEYCTSVHSMAAENAGLDWETIEKIRHRKKLPDERHEALRTFTERVVKDIGNVPHDALTQFKSVGFDEQNALDVIVGVTLKTLTNTTNHLMETPLDEKFQKRAWSVDDKKKAATA